MSPENTNSAVAGETRVNLASLFCMVGRHGPAVVLALIATGSLLLVGVTVYRTVRWKRRKATTTDTDTASDRDSRSPGAQRDEISPRHEAIPEESSSSSSSSSVESTGVSDGVRSGVKEEGDVKVRHRRAASSAAASAADDEKKHHLLYPSPPASDVQTMDSKHTASGQRSEVFKAEDMKDKNVTGDEQTKEEKEDFHCASSSQMYFNPAPCTNDNVVNERLQDNKVTPEVNGLESNFQDHLENLDHSNHFSPEEERREVQQGVPQQDETCPSRSELNLLSSQHHWDNGHGQVCEVTGKDSGEDQVLTSSDTHPPQSDEHQHQMVQKDEHSLERRPTGDVKHSPGLLNEPVKFADDHEEELSVVKAQFSDVEVLPDLSVDFQPLQSQLKDGELDASLDKEADFTIPDSYLPSIVKELKCEKNDTVVEEITEPPSYKHQIIFQVVNGETLGKTTQAPVTQRDKVNIATPVMSEEKSDDDMLTLSQDQESDQVQTNERPSVVAQDLNPPLSPIKLQSFEQSELRANVKDNIPSPGVGLESGISSMTVSPDVQDSGNEFSRIVGDVEDCDPKSEETTNAQNSLFADDVVLSVFNKETTDITFRHTDWTRYDPVAANEDMFGHEIEDSYNSALEQFMTPFAANGKDMKGTFEVVEIKEKKEVVRITKKAETGAENETEELHEKTEISIMEATMDSNEWLMDSNYQFLPTMNPYVPPLTPDHKKNSQLPTEDAAGAVRKETDIEASAEVRKPCSLASVDENAENYKKVVAVQPMPQNVYVTFRIHYVTHSPYQMVAITGNLQELGNWKEYIPMERAKDGHWTTVVSLPAESHLEWKFVIVDKGEVCRWEECGNRLLDTGCGDELTVHKLWGIL